MLRATQKEKLDAAVLRLHVHCDLEEFPIRVLECVGPLIASDVACFTELRPSSGEVRNFANLHDDGLEAMLPVLAELQMQHPHIADYFTTGQPRALAVSDYLSQRDWHRLDVYQHFYGALNIEDQIAVMLPPSFEAHVGLAFNRASRSFTHEEHQLLAALRPHLALAYQNADAVSRLKAQSDSPLAQRPHGVVRLRNDGTVWFATKRAREMLDRRWPDRTRLRWSLPGPVQAWIESTLRRTDRNRVDAADRVQQTAGLTLRLLQSPENSGWLLLLESPSLEDELAAAGVTLPPRLRRVLERMLCGESEKEIATRLELSPHTVHEYAKQLYRRLAVSSRAELMAKFVSR